MQQHSAERAKQMDSKELGLAVAIGIGRYFFAIEDLHYGLWPDGMAVNLENFKKAQELHSELILGAIPEGTKSVLDVGCGAGKLAQRMLGKGYAVECVSPSSFLTERAREVLGNGVTINETTFEDFIPKKKYDLVLFSESFQYVNLEKTIPRIAECLNPGGHLLICDFFKIPAEGKSPISGGHRIEKVLDGFKAAGFELKKDQDITKETAPNIDLLGDVFMKVGKPLRDLLFEYASSNHPLVSKVVKWRMKKRIEKLDRKFFSNGMNGAAFTTFKTYRLLLYRKP